MMQKTVIVCLLTLLSLSSFPSLAATEVSENKKFRPPGSDRFIYQGSIQLPAKGRWLVDKSSEGQQPVYLAPSAKDAKQIGQQNKGRRIAAMEQKRKKKQIGYTLRSIVNPAADYARQHDNIGPAATSDLDHKQYKYVLKRFNKVIDAQGQSQSQTQSTGQPAFFLLPKVRFHFSGNEQNSRIKEEDRQLLAISLQPLVDDGKHWLIYTDRTSERELIDQQLLDRYNLVVRPLNTQTDSSESPSLYTYSIITQPATQDTASLPLSLRNPVTGAKKQILWQLSGATAGDASLKKALDIKRQASWRGWYRLSHSPILAGWLQKSFVSRADRRQQQNSNNTSMFAVMGGRAAVRETLQMQLMAPADKDEPRTIDIASIQGVTVKSHPFEKMLAGQKGGQLELADLVPLDHFFLYAAKPATLLPMLDDGAGFLSRLGGTMRKSTIKYFLKEKYLSRLGLNQQWIELFLNSEAVRDCAIIAPDLFFIDGTDITVITRLENPAIILPLLKMIKVSGLSESGIISRETTNNRKAFWAIKDDLLLVSTSRSELQEVIALAESKGKNSLGQSAEFRYMLTQLPVQEQTRAYAYLSDPFIRNLVGPKTKINQLRRMIARAEMEQITARALLGKLDGISPLTLEHLSRQGYLSAELTRKGYSMDEDLLVHSQEYGTVKDLTPLQATPLDKISKQEADNYAQYLEQYNRFWNRFFDPIAIRLNDVQEQGKAALEASVFILPLIDNTIYNSLKEILVNRETGTAMRIPTLSPNPVLLLSLNLREEAWVGLSAKLAEMLSRYARINPAFIDDLGPALHLAINDADPVIALGSGDLMGAFGGNITGMGRNSAMLMLPAALAVLTRPCTLAVETSDPDTSLRYLMNAAKSKRPARRRMTEVNVEFYQVAGEDSWIFSFDIMGMVTLRYGIEIRDGFVMIRNIPWSTPSSIEQISTSPLNGARLAVYPGAGKLQLSGLYAATVEHQSAAAMEGAGLLYPLLESGCADIDTAAKKHLALFGFMPAHPGNGSWQWQNNQVVSSQFGSIYRRQFPKYQQGDSGFGLMQDIEEFAVQMQFEESGLRTQIRWSTVTVRPPHSLGLQQTPK